MGQLLYLSICFISLYNTWWYYSCKIDQLLRKSKYGKLLKIGNYPLNL